MTTLNNIKNIPLSQRPKLYIQMEKSPYDLVPLDTNILFNYLQGGEKYSSLTFKYYSEFLNVLNTIIFYYILCYHNTRTKSIDLVIFLGVDILFIAFAFGYYFLITNKQNKQNTKIILIFAVYGIFLSKLINFLSHSKNHDLNKIHKYIKLNYILFSLAFILFYDYFTNPGSPSSTTTKIIYSGMAFVMTNLVGSVEEKIRIFLYAINFFEFIPEIRKLLSNYSSKQNLICYLINFIWTEGFMLYMEKYMISLRILVFNALFIVLYPIIFDFYYKKDKKLIKGLWDLPQVTSYY